MSLDDIFGKGSPIPGHLKKRSDEVIQKEEKLFENKSKDTINTAPVKAAMKELRALEADAALAKHAASVPLPIDDEDEEQETELIAPGKPL